MREQSACGRAAARSTAEAGSLHALDDPDELLQAIAVLASEADELPRLHDDRPMVRGGDDGDASPAAKLEQPLVAQLAKGAQDGVPVDAELGREVAGRRQPLTRLRLPLGDRPADLARHLFVEVGGLLAIDLDTEHGASNTSFL
jgi:hypothetical protein